jgi:drug/metabolite transporter (DMT)-like permease|tara:strand:+ start:188 stop:430 length:243 start_codon:yes stop_codon:yes gene_type:complete
MSTIFTIFFFSVLISLLLLLIFYVNRNIKTFIDLEDNDIKMYLKLFGLLGVILFLVFYIFYLVIPSQSISEPAYTGEAPF